MKTPEHVHAVGSSTSQEFKETGQLVGVWSLLSYTEEARGRENKFPFGAQPQGFLIYTADGFVSAQLMRPGRSAFHSTDWHCGTLAEYREAASGYIAYSGTYEVDRQEATVTHFASVSLLPNLLGGRQRRSIHLHGDRLTLMTEGLPSDDAVGTVVKSRLEWRKVLASNMPNSPTNLPFTKEDAQ